MQYRKKPIIVEAFQYEGRLKGRYGWIVPEWAVRAYEAGVLFHLRGSGNELFIRTLEGNMHVSKGSYIIRGVQGELYACDPKAFAKTYEAIDDEEIF